MSRIHSKVDIPNHFFVVEYASHQYLQVYFWNVFHILYEFCIYPSLVYMSHSVSPLRKGFITKVHPKKEEINECSQKCTCMSNVLAFFSKDLVKFDTTTGYSSH